MLTITHSFNMRSSDKRISLLVLLLVGLQRNAVSTQSDNTCYPCRKFHAISRLNVGSQSSSDGIYPQQQTTSVYQSIKGGSNQVGTVQQQFDQRVSDFIAFHVSQFSHNVGVRLVESQYSKSEVFSPVSVMSALALLMLGAKGKSYKELRKVFGIDLDQELLNNPSKFHTELGYMLEDLQSNSNTLRSRENTYWRSTSVNHNMRNNNNNNNSAGNGMDHITKIANGIFTQTGYSLNPDYR